MPSTNSRARTHVLRLSSSLTPNASSPSSLQPGSPTANQPTARRQERVRLPSPNHGHSQKIRVENRAAPDRKSKTPSSESQLWSHSQGALRLIYLAFNRHNIDSNHGLQVPYPCPRTASRLRPTSNSSRRRQHHRNLLHQVRSTSILQPSSSLPRIRVRMLFHLARFRRCSLATQIQRGWLTTEIQTFHSIYPTPR